MRRLWLVPALAVVLSACGVDPVDDRRGDVAAVIDAANARDAAGVRNAVAELRATLRAQVASQELDRAEAERLNAIALRLLEGADLLEQPAAPSPTPEEPEATPTPTPTPEDEPTEEPTEEPSEEPTEEPSEEPSEEPTEEPEPIVTLGVEEPGESESPPPAQSQSAPSAEPTTAS